MVDKRGAWVEVPYVIFVLLRCSPMRAMASSFLRFSRSHNAPLGLLWTSDKLVAETSTWQHTKLTKTNIHAPGGFRTHNLSRRAAADIRLRSHGQWDRHRMSWHGKKQHSTRRLFSSKLDSDLGKKPVKCYIWYIAFVWCSNVGHFRK